MDDRSKPSADTKQKTRRERKRETDRVAQQEHRKRQRLQVEDLKAELKFWRSSTDVEQVAVLSAANETLRSDLKPCVAALSATQSVLENFKDSLAVMEERTRTTPSKESLSTKVKATIPGRLRSVSPCCRQQKEDSALGSSRCPDPEAWSPSDLTSAYVDDSILEYSEASTIDHEPQTFGDEVPITQDVLTLIHTGTGTGLVSDEDMGAATSGQVSDMSFVMDQTGMPAIEDRSLASSGALRDAGTDEVSTTDASIAWTFALMRSPLNRASITLSKPAGPTNVSAQQGDTYWFALIQKGKRAMSSKFRSLDPRRSIMCQSTYLSTILQPEVENTVSVLRAVLDERTCYRVSWAVHMILKWQICGNQEAFEELPSWLRPTERQSRVPHSIIIDFVVWPYLRDELIDLYVKDPDQILPIVTTIGEATRFVFSAEDPSPTDQSLTAELYNLNNWRLDRSFFNTHPQLELAYWRSMISTA